MIKMKRNSLIIGVFATTALFSACNDDDFLTEKPKTLYTVDNAFEKSTQVNAALTTVYNDFKQLHGYHVGNRYFALEDFASNLLQGAGTDCLDGDGQAAHAADSYCNWLSLNPDINYYNYLWNDLYKMAADANLVLYGSTLVNWTSESDRNNAESQAKFFLGWAYLRLGECFGGVPIVEEYTEELKFDYERTTRDAVYAFAIKNLEDAIAGLPEYPSEKGRVAKGAASHYLAEAYLAQGVELNDNSYFSKAAQAAQNTINLHPLMTERFGTRANPADKGTSNGVANYKPEGNVYFDLFQRGNYSYNEGNTESLLIIPTPTYEQYQTTGVLPYALGLVVYAPLRDAMYSDAYKEEGAAGGPWSSNILLEGGAQTPYLGGSGWGMVGSNDYMDDVVWENQFAVDMRNEQVNRINPVILDSKHSLYGQVATKEMLRDPAMLMRISAKVSFPDYWGFEPYRNHFGGGWVMQFRDWHACRSAETYLLLAEAQLRGGDAATAAKTLNVVRDRANAEYKYSTVDIYDILAERARELSWEEQRWPTLLRMGSSKDGKNEVMKHQLETYSQMSYDLGMKTPAPAWTLFPIPTTVINLNSGATLEQNPGWN